MARKLRRGTKVSAYGLKYTVAGQSGKNVFVKSPKGKLYEIKRKKVKKRR